MSPITFTNQRVGIKVFTKSKTLLNLPYIKFRFLGLTNWGDLNNKYVDDWYFLGIKIISL